ncbi:hypothetical protein HXX76_000905 [Chlamydomonas incerta]|uniref:SANT domain-containing protein n=1 Tax=Chlamydomonas incerta TaxID=51695 RepID=A0A836B392_CHLIN|nr:hypothetical protein HXX76_000905 [Chlamydomonas incerta]|eukprot:KAG2446317.1 hypothetical protein HXX76_000905 [Chlamydomonas incerta]
MLLLAILHAETGNRWKDISKNFRKRSETDVKNIYYSSMRLVSTDNNLGRRLLSSYATAVRDCHGDPALRRAALEAKKAEHGVDDEYCEQILQSGGNGKSGARPVVRAATPGPTGTPAVTTAGASGVDDAGAAAAAAPGGDAVATTTMTAAGAGGAAAAAAVGADTSGVLVDGATSRFAEAGGSGRAAGTGDRLTQRRKTGREAQSAPLPDGRASRRRAQLAGSPGSGESGEAGGFDSGIGGGGDGVRKRAAAAFAPLGPILAAAVAHAGLASDSAAAGGHPASKGDGYGAAAGGEPLLWPLSALEGRLRRHLAAAAAAAGNAPGAGGGGRGGGGSNTSGAEASGPCRPVWDPQSGSGYLPNGGPAAQQLRRLPTGHDEGQRVRAGAEAGLVFGLGDGLGLGLRFGGPPSAPVAVAGAGPGRVVAATGAQRRGGGEEPYVPLRTMSAAATSVTLGARSGLFSGLSEAASVTAPMRSESMADGSCRPLSAPAAAAMTSSIPTAPTSTPATSSAAAAAAAGAAAMVPRELMAVALKQAAAAATAAVAGLAFDSPSHSTRSTAPGLEARRAAASTRSAPDDEAQDAAAAYHQPPLHKRQRHEAPSPPSRQLAPPLPLNFLQPLRRPAPRPAAAEDAADARELDHAHMRGTGGPAGVDHFHGAQAQQLSAQSQMLLLRPLGHTTAPKREVMVPVMVAPPSPATGAGGGGTGSGRAGGAGRGSEGAHAHAAAGSQHRRAPQGPVPAPGSTAAGEEAAASRLQADAHKQLLRQHHQQQVQQLAAQQRALEHQLLQTRVRQQQLMLLQMDEQQDPQQQVQQPPREPLPLRKRSPVDDVAVWVAAHPDRTGGVPRGQDSHLSLAAALQLAALPTHAEAQWDLDHRAMLPVGRPPQQSLARPSGAPPPRQPQQQQRQQLARSASETYGLELLCEVADEAAHEAAPSHSVRSAPAQFLHAPVPALGESTSQPIIRLGTGRSYDVGGSGDGGGGGGG